MPTRLPALALIAKEAGDKILSMQPDIVLHKKWEEKPDGSIVTPADKEANRIVNERLTEHFPGVAIVSEENSDASNAIALKATKRFESDPLDNTTGYAKGKDGFSVNIGLIEQGVPIAGVIYFPAKKELYFTGDDGKAYLQSGEEAPREIKVKGLPLRDPLRVAVGFNEQNLAHLQGKNYDAQSYPAQYRTCMVAKGECDLSGINKGDGGGFNSWDTAGPHAVLRAAGGEMITTGGKPIRYGEDIKLPDHIVGGVDTLEALNLAERSALKTGRRKS
jgi:3'(2'), 5'-bisphosphate nucleotidase